MKKIKDTTFAYLAMLKRANQFILNGPVRKILKVWIPVSFIESQTWIITSWYFGEILNRAIYDSDKITPENATWHILSAILIYVLIEISIDVLSFINSRYRNYFGKKVNDSINIKFNEKIESLDLPDHENPVLQDAISNANRNIGSVSGMFFHQWNILRNILTLVTACAALSFFEWYYAILIIASVIPRVMMNHARRKRRYEQNKRMVQLRKWTGELSPQLTQKETKVFQRGSFFLDRIKSLGLKSSKIEFLFSLKIDRLNLAINILSNLLFAVVIYDIFFKIFNHELLAGSFMVCLGSLRQVSSALQGMANELVESDITLKEAGDFFKVFDAEPSIKEREKPIAVDISRSPFIFFDNVSFKYPDSENWALRNVSLKIAPDSHVGIVGENGSGKSTFINLLLRLYDPTEGRVLINGTDLKDLSRNQYYKMIGVLFQDFSILKTKVAYAISMGDPNVPRNMEKIMEAAKKANMHDTILALPGQYFQQLGRKFNNGTELSKGQNQKLAMAQVFYRDPKMIVLDEPTASLDPLSEAEIFRQYRELCSGRTSIMVSHRFCTLKDVDRIIVFKEGRVIEDGNHDELMLVHGLYRNMYEAQYEHVMNK